MRLSAYILLFCLTCNFAFAQNSPKVKKFINDVMDEKNTHDSITLNKFYAERKIIRDPNFKHKSVYKDSIDRTDINNMREAMQNYKTGVFFSVRKDSLIYIDSLGKRTVMARIDAEKLDTRRRWRVEQILADSIIITENEKAYINTEINKMTHHTWGNDLLLNARLVSADSIKSIFKDVKFDGWNYLKIKGVDKVYSFGMPIFFRNDTYCLFYYGYGCGYLCGEGEVAIYKKINGKWIKWSSLSSWVS